MLRIAQEHPEFIWGALGGAGTLLLVQLLAHIVGWLTL